MEWTAVANLVGACLAVAANLWGMSRGTSHARPLWGACAALAALWAGGYVWLLVTQDAMGWQHFYDSVQLVVWPVVYCAGPIVSVRHQARVTSAAECLLAQVRPEAETEVTEVGV